MIIDYVEYIENLKNKQCYGEAYKKKIYMLEKLYEWEIIEFSSLVDDVNIVWEDWLCGG